MAELADSYFKALGDTSSRIEVTDTLGASAEIDSAINNLIQKIRSTHDSGNKIIFIGNGGSAAIASHMAIDYSKNGNFRATALNDPAALTCLSNDLGYEKVFLKQIELHGRAGDMLVAISSSGSSRNILNAVEIARAMNLEVVTLSGFHSENPLRSKGHTNFYVPSSEYGLVEILHLCLCHAVLDIADLGNF